MTFKSLTNQLIAVAVISGLFFIGMVASTVVAAKAVDDSPASNRGILIWAAIYFALSAAFGFAVTLAASFAAYNVERVSETITGTVVGKVTDAVAGAVTKFLGQ